jgi:hypothetical protein
MEYSGYSHKTADQLPPKGFPDQHRLIGQPIFNAGLLASTNDISAALARKSAGFTQQWETVRTIGATATG